MNKHFLELSFEGAVNQNVINKSVMQVVSIESCPFNFLTLSTPSPCPMDDSHRLFLQHFLQHPVLEALKLKELYMLCTQSPSFGKESFTSFLKVVNDQLSLLDLCIRRGNCHVTGELFFVLCNLAPDVASCEFGLGESTKSDLLIIRQILRAICCTAKKRCTSIELLNTCGRHLTDKRKIESLLERLVQDQWLHRRSDYFYLGIRSTVELGSWLEAEFIFPKCQVCKEFVSGGRFCRRDGTCESPSHVHCLEKLLGDNEEARCVACTRMHE